MKTRTKFAAAGLIAAGCAAAGIGIAGAAGDDDATETPIPSDDLDRASAVALEHIGQGRVSGTEVDDEESYYEVEVTLEDGNQVDVQLDRSFRVVSDIADSDEGED
ncbi:MAG: PepSY domain-containing protein [Microthrixaceae bacterium]